MDFMFSFGPRNHNKYIICHLPCLAACSFSSVKFTQRRQIKCLLNEPAHVPDPQLVAQADLEDPRFFHNCKAFMLCPCTSLLHFIKPGYSLPLFAHTISKSLSFLCSITCFANLACFDTTSCSGTSSISSMLLRHNILS